MEKLNIKKKSFRIIIVLGAIFLILALFLGYEYLKYKNSVEIENKGFVLISQDKYIEGLQKCLEKPYKISPCYAFAFANMLAKNQTIQREFCESIPLDDKTPFWDLKEKQADYYEKVKELKTQCYKVYFTKTLGINDIQRAEEFAENNDLE